MRTVLMPFVLSAVLVLPTVAQDMVAVSFSGRVHALDSVSGSTTQLAIGAMGGGALARDENGDLWSTAQVGQSFFLTRIDAVAGEVSFAHPSVDLRGLAEAGGAELWGIESRGVATWRLWRIDTASGVHTLVGSTGTTVIQGLAMHQGVLWGWHLSAGLMRIDTTTGQATDPFPGLGGPTVQWLAAHAGGLIGGTAGSTPMLVHIDTGTGMATPGASLSPFADLRGAEFASFALPFGTGCSVGNGPLTLGASGVLAPGQTVTVESQNHLPGTLRISALGFSRTSFNSTPLPFLLDPLTGSSGCHLYVSLEVTQFHLGSGFPTPVMSLPLALPAWLPTIDLHVQHFDMNQPWNPPGSSNGLLLHVRS